MKLGEYIDLHELLLHPLLFVFVLSSIHFFRGKEFRTDFARIGEIRSLLPQNTNLMALTATAPPHLLRDLKQSLPCPVDPGILRGSLQSRVVPYDPGFECSKRCLGQTLTHLSTLTSK